jgi:hypothetical protein
MSSDWLIYALVWLGICLIAAAIGLVVGLVSSLPLMLAAFAHFMMGVPRIAMLASFFVFPPSLLAFLGGWFVISSGLEERIRNKKTKALPTPSVTPLSTKDRDAELERRRNLGYPD